MTSSGTNNDYVAVILDKLTSGQQPSSTFIRKADNYYKSATERLKKIEPVPTKSVKAGNDFVADVLDKLNVGKQPPKSLTQKAVKYYESVRKKLTKFEDISPETQITEVVSLKENRLETNKDKSGNVLTLCSLSFNTKQFDASTQEDPDKRELYKVIEANAKHISENKRLKEALDAATSELESLSKHKKEQAENDNRNTNDDSVRRELQTSKGKFSKLKDENTTLEQELQSARDAREETENQSKHFFVDNNVKKIEKRLMKEEIEYLRETNEKLTNKNTSLERKLNSADQNLDQQLNKIKKLSENMNEKDTDAVAIRKELQNQTNINSIIDAENASLKSDLTSAKVEIESQFKEIKDLTTTVHNLKQDDSARKVIQRLRKENERLGSNITDIMQKLKAAELEIEKKTTEIEKEQQKGFNSSPDTDYSRLHEKLRQLNNELSDENKKLDDEVNDLKNRFSALAGHKLTADNPNIADLSDLYRPTKIAEQLKLVYDDEWTEAYEELEKDNSEDETKSIDTLATILKNIEAFCVEVSAQQFDTLKSTLINEIAYPKYQHKSGTVIAGRHRAEMSVTQAELADKLLKDLRKSLGILSTGPLTQIFQQVYLTEYGDGVAKPKLNAYLAQAVKLVWMMKMQAPPMGFIWAESNETVEKNKFTFYTKRGDVIKQCVWPAVVLHENGPVMSKGIVQAY